MAAFSVLREIGEQLGRFASIREKAESPMDRIVVQASGGILKLIAGNHQSTIIATVGQTEQEGRAVVSSRLLLNSLKTLKAKGEADFLLKKGGAVIQTGFGSAIEMPGMDMAHFLRPSIIPWSDDEPTVTFLPGFLPDAAKYLLACVGDFSPFNQVVLRSDGTDAYLQASDNHMSVKVTGLYSNQVLSAHFPAEAFSSLRGIEAGGWLWFPQRIEKQAERVQINADRYVVVMVLWPNYPNFPKVTEHEYTAKVTGNRKTLIDAFKALAGRDQYSRVVLEATDGTFTVVGGDGGKAKLDVVAEGSGSLPVNATYIAKVLNTVGGANVTIEYADAPSLVRIIGDKQWPILLAPMK